MTPEGNALEFLGEPSAFFCDCDGAPRWVDYEQYGRHQNHEAQRDALGELVRP